MTESVKNAVLVALLGLVAFLLGRGGSAAPVQPTLAAEPLPSARAPGPPEVVLPAQGRRRRDKGKKDTGTGTDPLVFESSSGASGASNGFIAVTGSYGIGTSVLYVLDTRTKQLAVYEARGGGRNTRRIVLVGARRVDLDLQLEGYNDESEFSYADLRARFTKKGLVGDKTVTPPAAGRTKGR